MEWQLILFLLLCLVGVLILLYFVRKKFNSPPSQESAVQSFKEEVQTSTQDDILKTNQTHKYKTSRNSNKKQSQSKRTPKDQHFSDYEIPKFEARSESEFESADSEDDEEVSSRTSEEEVSNRLHDVEEETLPFYKDPDYLNSRHSRINEMMPSLSQLRSQLDDFNRDRREKAKRKGKGCREMKFGQFICQRTLEIIFDKPFPETRDFLVNPETGRPLEYDCYNDELKIGLEFQGSQHRIWKKKNRYSMTKEQFIGQYRRDDYKVRQSEEDGITLLVIWDDIKYDQISAEIADLIPARYDGYRRDIVLLGGDED